MALVPAIAVPVVIIAGLVIQIPLNRAVRSGFHQAEEKSGVLFETIGGLETIKSVGADPRMRHKWETSVGQSARSNSRSRYLSNFALNLTSFVQQMSSVGVVVVGVFLIAAGQLSVGDLGQ